MSMRCGYRVFWGLACLLVPASLVAEEGPLLPDIDELADVDVLTPVPGPDPLFGVQPADAFKMPAELNIRNMGGSITGNPNEGWVEFGGPVKITTSNGEEVFANHARMDTKAETVTFTGDVSVYQENTLQRGSQVVYYYERKFLDTSGLRASMDMILLESGKFTSETINGRTIYTGTDAAITTHDFQDPNFWLRATKTTVYPGDRVVFRNLTLEAAGIPIFWLPYLSQPLNAELGYHFVPGTRSNWGPFILNTYGIMLGGERDPLTGENPSAWLLSRWKFDIRSQRGVGLGVDLVDTRLFRENRNITGLELYHTYDLDPDAVRSGRPAQRPVDENRYRAALKHRHEFKHTGDANWWVDANFTLLSDERFLDDFEPQRFRIDPQPDNTLGVFRRDEHSLASIFARFRVNDFYRTDTRLPEIAYDQSSRPVFGLPLLHEGTTSWALLGEKASNASRKLILDPLLAMAPGDPGAPALLRQLEGTERVIGERISVLPLGDPRRDALSSQLLDFGFTRFHSYHEFSLPFQFANILQVVPQMGLGYTRYDGVDSPLASFDRTHFHIGAEASLKFTRRFGGFVAPAWGLNGLSHVFQPYANWSIVSTNSTDSTFLGIDRLTPTTRPLPLDPLRFTAIDDLRNWNTLRLGGRHRLLTRRDGGSHEWLFMDNFIDVFIDDPEGDRERSNLINTLRWSPLPWATLGVNTQFPIAGGGSGFSEFSSFVQLMPRPDLELRMGYSMLKGHPILIDSSYLDIGIYKSLNERWGIGSRHLFQLDDNVLELQQYTVHRNYGSWVVSAGLTHRDNRFEDEYSLIFSVSLREFPSIYLPFRIDGE